MAQVSLPFTSFSFADGTPVRNGYVLIRLSQDGSIPAQSLQICTASARVNLSDTGTVLGTYSIWQNADISPVGTYYIFTVYSATGELAAGPLLVTI